MQGGEALVIMTIVAGVFGIFFLRSRENMAMIDKNINPRRRYSGPKPYAYMKYALLLVGAGIGLFLAYMIDVMYLQNVIKELRADGTHYSQENPAIYFSLLAIGGGLGMFSAYKLEKKDMLRRPEDRTEFENQ